MITVLNFCHNDREQAFNLLRQIGELGGVKHHELILQCNVVAAAQGMHQELDLLARDIFGKVVMRVTDEQDERGWPMSSNTAWRDTVYFMRMKIGKPWLWLEGDCAVVGGPTWLDQIEADYEKALAAGKHFMGAEVMKPQHRMSGIGVYPGSTTTFTRSLPLLNKVPWDQRLAEDFAPFVYYTKLIQNVWNTELGKPTPPTFPDQASLKLLAPEAVIFHRCKDGSLLHQLRERKAGDELRTAYALEPTNNSTPCAPSISRPAVTSNAAPTFQPEGAADAKLKEAMAEIARLKSQINADTGKATVSHAERKAQVQARRVAGLARAREAKAAKRMASA